jgi:ATP-dependent Clp protease ATP-binding subunit ClpC
MFERYTKAARRVVFFARYEVSQYGSQCIEPEHTLLGLMHERPSFLKGRLSLDPVTNLRLEIEPTLNTGPRFTMSVEVPLSEGTKSVLEHARAEADRLSHSNVGTEHILFGILENDECPASRVLRAHGLMAIVPREER